MPNTDKNTPMPQCDKNAVSDIPRIITPKEQALYFFEAFNLLAETRITKMDRKVFSAFTIKQIINACEYNNVESHNTDWWNKVTEELNKLYTYS